MITRSSVRLSLGSALVGVALTAGLIAWPRPVLAAGTLVNNVQIVAVGTTKQGTSDVVWIRTTRNGGPCDDPNKSYVDFQFAPSLGAKQTSRLLTLAQFAFLNRKFVRLYRYSAGDDCSGAEYLEVRDTP